MTAPRTILTLTAALDAVMVRVDAAGLRPEQIVSVSLHPQVWGVLMMPVHVEVQLRNRNDGFAEMVSVLGVHQWADYGDWISAAAKLPDGTEVTVSAPAELTVTAPVGGAA